MCNAANYQLEGKIQSPSPKYSGFYGMAIAFSGNRMVVGEEGGAHAYIYTRGGELVKTVKTPTDPDDSLFGRSVAIYGEHIIVGDPYAKINNLTHSGAIYIYDLEGNPELTKTSPTPQENGGFGFSLATDSHKLAVSEPAVFGLDQNVTARVHVFDDINDASPQTYTEPQNSTGHFGWSVALRGDTLAVGEPYTWYSLSSPGGTRGIVHLYSFNEKSDNQTLKSPIGHGFGNFGFSVSIGEDVVAVGEVRGDANSTEMAGTVHLYNRTGDFLKTLYPPKPIIYGYFGVSLTVSEKYIVVNQKGHLYFYDHTGNYLFTVSGVNSLGAFGNDCVVDGNLLAAGASYESVDSVEGAGSVYLYRLLTPADIHVKKIEVSKSRVTPGENLNVTVELENLGEAAGNYTIIIMLDGVVASSNLVLVEGNSTITKTHGISSSIVGLSQVSVGDKSTSFEVAVQGIPSYPIESVLYGVAFAIIIGSIRGRQRVD